MYEKMFDLAGRVAIVTGASRGLGKVMARAYAEYGADVFLCARGADEMRRAAEEIGSGLPVRVEWTSADMAEKGGAQAIADQAINRFGRVDVVVNNVGGNLQQRADLITDDAWEQNLEVNLSAAMRLTRALLPQMMERRWGRVIHITSILGMGGRKERNAYSAAKAGLIGMCRSSALDLGPYGITVNCIAPGLMLTERLSKVLTPADQLALAERTALGRWGCPQEIAGAAVLLASEAGSYITGSTFVVDGGTLSYTL